MKKNTIISIAVFTLLFIGAIAIKSCLDKQTTVKQVKSLVTGKIDTVTQWVDADSQKHTKNEVYVVSLEAALAAKDGRIQQLKDKLHLRDNQIKDMIEVMSSSSGTISTPVFVYIDSTRHDSAGNPLRVQQFNYADEWIQEAGEISNGIADIDYTVKVPIELTTYWRRKWFLGKKKYYIDGTSKNPNVTINGLHEVMIRQRIPGRFGIGPYIGVDGGGKFSAGVALTWSLLRF